MEIPSIADQDIQFIDEDPIETKKKPEVFLVILKDRLILMLLFIF